VIGHGYVLPAIGGTVVVGSSYDVESTDAGPTVESHEGNLVRPAALAPANRADVDATALVGGVGFRAVVAYRLPLVGPLPDPEAPSPGADRVAAREGLYAIGAFASRGLVWSALAGDPPHDGEPLPVENDLGGD
jgi:hypothetical protein